MVGAPVTVRVPLTLTLTLNLNPNPNPDQVLGLFGARQAVTSLLRRTWCWRYFKAPVDTSYSVLDDTSSGGFVPTASFAHRPERATAPAVLAANFLARMGGPSMDLVALGLRPIDELPAPERSAFEAAEARSPPPSPPPLPEGWQQAVIFATGRRYYVHAA